MTSGDEDRRNESGFVLDITTEVDPELGASLSAIPRFDGEPLLRGDILEPWEFTKLLDRQPGYSNTPGVYVVTEGPSGIIGGGGLNVTAEHRADGLRLRAKHDPLRSWLIPWGQVEKAVDSFLEAFDQVATVMHWSPVRTVQVGTLYGNPFDAEDAKALRSALRGALADAGVEPQS